MSSSPTNAIKKGKEKKSTTGLVLAMVSQRHQHNGKIINSPEPKIQFKYFWTSRKENRILNVKLSTLDNDQRFLQTTAMGGYKG